MLARSVAFLVHRLAALLDLFRLLAGLSGLLVDFLVPWGSRGVLAATDPVHLCRCDAMRAAGGQQSGQYFVLHFRQPCQDDWEANMPCFTAPEYVR